MYRFQQRVDDEVPMRSSRNHLPRERTSLECAHNGQVAIARTTISVAWSNYCHVLWCRRNHQVVSRGLGNTVVHHLFTSLFAAVNLHLFLPLIKSARESTCSYS